MHCTKSGTSQFAAILSQFHQQNILAMQFLTSRAVIYIRVILLLTAAFWVATDAKTLFHSNFVLLLGEAMRLPIIPVDPKSPANGMIALVLGLNALTDLVPCMADNVEFFDTLIPTRLFGFFMLTAYVYLVEDRIISNNVTFVYAFLEVWINFLIFNNLRDEKYNRLKDYLKEHGEDLMREAGEQVRVVDDN